MAGAPRGGYYYDPNNNANRRARATYAWDYQRRRTDTPRAQRTNYHQEKATSSGAAARAASGASFGSGGASPWAAAADGSESHFGRQSHFERLAAAQRRREEMARASGRGRAASGFTYQQEAKDQEAESWSPVWRFVQVVGLMFFIFKAGTLFAEPAGGRSLRSEELKGEEGNEKDELEEIEIVVLERERR
ncbi:hypothetical protein IE53DRAFT_386106 [Violaceomyces palustris]|uniref:Uncharacterized protein n=1 Tax=Violaceomyces palustris TaxID=1673888 RepID=A0ACD0P0A9_9BASI|nr:hypothetical protein IE53DRAFT_386106 [Violaceomyces palustris]